MLPIPIQKNSFSWHFTNHYWSVQIKKFLFLLLYKLSDFTKLFIVKSYEQESNRRRWPAQGGGDLIRKRHTFGSEGAVKNILFGRKRRRRRHYIKFCQCFEKFVLKATKKVNFGKFSNPKFFPGFPSWIVQKMSFLGGQFFDPLRIR